MSRYVIDEQGRVFLVEANGDVVRAENLRTGHKCDHPDRIILPAEQPIQQTSDLRFWVAVGGAAGLALLPVFAAFLVLLWLVGP